MTGEDVKSAKIKLKLSYSQMGKLLGVDGRTVMRWTKNGVTGAADVLIRLLVQGARDGKTT